jgi:hypothetical protein
MPADHRPSTGGALPARREEADLGRLRLTPTLASAGFLKNPLIRDNDDVKSWYADLPVPRVASFRVEGSPAATACYGNRARVVIGRYRLHESVRP